MMYPSLCYVFVFVKYFGCALSHNLPREPPLDNSLDPKVWTLRPTQAPRISAKLRQRQLLPNNVDYVLISPDRTCGYVDGLPGSNFGCIHTTGRCMFFPMTGESLGAVACCSNLADCNFGTSCVDSAMYFGTSSACDGGCRLDQMVLKCTDAASLFYNSIRYQSTAQDYWCDTESLSSWQTAFATINGESDGRVFSTVQRPDLSTAMSRTLSTPRASSPVQSGSYSQPDSPSQQSPSIPLFPDQSDSPEGSDSPNQHSPQQLWRKDNNTPSIPEARKVNEPPSEMAGTWTHGPGRLHVPHGYNTQQACHSPRPSHAYYQPIIAEMPISEEYTAMYLKSMLTDSNPHEISPPNGSPDASPASIAMGQSTIAHAPSPP